MATTSLVVQLSEETVNELKELFDLYDEDETGTILTTDDVLGTILRATDCVPSAKFLQEIQKQREEAASSEGGGGKTTATSGLTASALPRRSCWKLPLGQI